MSIEGLLLMADNHSASIASASPLIDSRSSEDEKIGNDDNDWATLRALDALMMNVSGMIGNDVLLSYRGVTMDELIMTHHDNNLTLTAVGGRGIVGDGSQNFFDAHGDGVSDSSAANSGGESITRLDGAHSSHRCSYETTAPSFMDIKVPFVLGFGCAISLLSIANNTFLSYLFVTRPTFRHSHLFFLAILAGVDIFMAFSYIALMSTQVLFDWTDNIWLYHLWLKYFSPMLAVSLSLMTMSTYLIVAATFERFLKTVTSLKPFRQMCERSRPLIVLLCFLFGLLIHGTKLWEISIKVNENCTGFAEYSLEASQPLYGSRIFHFYFRSFSHVIVPFVALLIMNGVIIWKLNQTIRATKKTRCTLQRQASSFIRTKCTVKDATRMLIACVSLYLISNCLSLVVTCWEFFDLSGLFNHYVFYTFANDTISMLPIVCGAVRLPIYCLCNTSIRQHTASLLFRTPADQLTSLYSLPSMMLKSSSKATSSAAHVPAAASVTTGKRKKDSCSSFARRPPELLQLQNHQDHQSLIRKEDNPADDRWTTRNPSTKQTIDVISTIANSFVPQNGTQSANAAVLLSEEKGRKSSSSYQIIRQQEPADTNKNRKVYNGVPTTELIHFGTQVSFNNNDDVDNDDDDDYDDKNDDGFPTKNPSSLVSKDGKRKNNFVRQKKVESIRNGSVHFM